MHFARFRSKIYAFSQVSLKNILGMHFGRFDWKIDAFSQVWLARGLDDVCGHAAVSLVNQAASTGSGWCDLDRVLARVFGHAAIALADRVASAGRHGAIWAAFWASGRGARHTPVLQCQIQRRGGASRRLFGRSKKRR